MVTGTMGARQRAQGAGAELQQLRGPERSVTDIGKDTSTLIGNRDGAGAPDASSEPVCICGAIEARHGPFGCEEPDGPEDLCSCRAFIAANPLMCGRCKEPIGNESWFTDDDGRAVVHPNCYWAGATCEVEW